MPVNDLAAEISLEQPLSLIVSVDAGDYVSGELQMPGPGAKLAVFDAAGNPLRSTTFPRANFTGGFFVAPATGTYRIELRAGDTAGPYVLNMNKTSAAQRMADVEVLPRVVYRSERLAALENELQAGTPGAMDQFWLEAEARGGPIIEPTNNDPGSLLVTFLWRETFPTYNVLLDWTLNRPDEYYLSHLPGSNVWYKTVKIRKGSRLRYWFSPNDRRPDRTFTSQTDPLNPVHFPENQDRTEQGAASVIELPGAPDDTWARRTPPLRGAVEQVTFPSALLASSLDFWVYTPPGFDPAYRRYPLLLLFESVRGPAYLNNTAAPTILDNLIAGGRIRPPVMVVLPTRPPIGADDLSAEAVATELLPWLGEQYGVSPAPRDVIVGGDSFGAYVAAYYALKDPQAFGNVLSQSGAFRQPLPGSTEPNTIAQLYAAAPLAPIRFYIDSGLYEPIPGLPLDELAMDESNTAGNRHFRDVLVAKGYQVTYRETGGDHSELHWRATLPEALMDLLKGN